MLEYIVLIIIVISRQILNNVTFVFEIDYDDGTVKHSTKSLGS